MTYYEAARPGEQGPNIKPQKLSAPLYSGAATNTPVSVEETSSHGFKRPFRIFKRLNQKAERHAGEIYIDPSYVPPEYRHKDGVQRLVNSALIFSFVVLALVYIL